MPNASNSAHDLNLTDQESFQKIIKDFIFGRVSSTSSVVLKLLQVILRSELGLLCANLKPRRTTNDIDDSHFERLSLTYLVELTKPRKHV